MNNSVRFLVMAIVLLGAASLLTACNTVAGAGKDVSATGHVVTHSAQKAKSGL